MLPYTANSLKKLEDLLQDLGYRIRYEKGNFKNAACVLQEENLVVINKFSDMGVKIRSMIAVIHSKGLPADFEPSPGQAKLLGRLKQISLDL